MGFAVGEEEVNKARQRHIPLQVVFLLKESLG
jgi:hypothetical protein